MQQIKNNLNHLKSEKTKLTRSHLAKEISNVTGFSRLYSKKLTEDLIAVLVNLIEKDNFSLKNFGTFKLINKKKELVGTLKLWNNLK